MGSCIWTYIYTDLSIDMFISSKLINLFRVLKFTNITEFFAASPEQTTVESSNISCKAVYFPANPSSVQRWRLQVNIQKWLQRLSKDAFRVIFTTFPPWKLQKIIIDISMLNFKTTNRLSTWFVTGQNCKSKWLNWRRTGKCTFSIKVYYKMFVKITSLALLTRYGIKTTLYIFLVTFYRFIFRNNVIDETASAWAYPTIINSCAKKSPSMSLPILWIVALLYIMLVKRNALLRKLHLIYYASLGNG